MIRLERRMVDLVDEFEIVAWPHTVFGHQPAHGRAVALVIVLLQLDSILIGKLEEVRDVIADPLVHLAPKVEVMRIERVVEIEHPNLDMAELTRCWACRNPLPNPCGNC